MAIEKFSVTVTLTTEVVVSFDTDKFTEEKMAEFRKYFYPFNTVQEHAEHIAQMVVRLGEDKFLEGYGNVSYPDYGISSEANDAEEGRDPSENHGVSIIMGVQEVETEVNP